MLTLPRSGHLRHVEWPSLSLLQQRLGLRRASPLATQAEHSNMFRARLGVHVQVAGFAVWGHSAQASASSSGRAATRAEDSRFRDSQAHFNLRRGQYQFGVLGLPFSRTSRRRGPTRCHRPSMSLRRHWSAFAIFFIDLALYPFLALSLSYLRQREPKRLRLEPKWAPQGEGEAEVEGPQSQGQGQGEAAAEAKAHARGAASSSSPSQYLVHRSSVLLRCISCFLFFPSPSLSLSLPLSLSLSPLSLSLSLSLCLSPPISLCMSLCDDLSCNSGQPQPY